jgi:hypothetical protein
MQDERIPSPAEDARRVEQAILALLSSPDEQWPWSVDEVAREIGDRIATLDALACLHGAGLVHRCGEFVFATRAARRAQELAL